MAGKDFLALLSRRKKDGPPLDVTCFYETIETELSIIVPKGSATLAGYKSIRVRANHRDIVRFEHDTHPTFSEVIDELHRWIEQFAMEHGEVAGIDPRQVRRCVDSLKFTQILDRQATIERATHETCNWVLENGEYRDWTRRRRLAESHGLLWIKGKLGSGKSVLTRFLWSRKPTLPGSVRLMFFFNARGAELERPSLGLYRSLLLQLILNKWSRYGTKAFITQLARKEEIFGEGNFLWQLTELQDAFHDLITSGSLPPLELFVDAIDECDEDGVCRFVRLFGLSATSAVQKGLNVNLCWSSRHYPHISTKFSFELCMEDQNRSDIQKFVHQELSTYDTIEDAFNDEQYIVDSACGIFLWASLVVRELVKAADKGI